MSESPLRELLTDLADLVEPVDLSDHVHRGVRRRRRILASTGAAGLVALTAASMLLLPTFMRTSSDSISSVGPSGVSQSPTPFASTSRTTSVRPSYLPPGTRLVDEQPVSSPNGGRTIGKEAEYQIPGLANANTMPAGPLTSAEAVDDHFHPATFIQVTFIAQLTNPGPVPCFPPECAQSIAQVDGHTATVAAFRNGYGVVRIDWLDSAGYHVVMCDRQKTSDGTSGIGPDELLRVAASLYKR
jgi:hypothetical protein